MQKNTWQHKKYPFPTRLRRTYWKMNTVNTRMARHQPGPDLSRCLFRNSYIQVIRCSDTESGVFTHLWTALNQSFMTGSVTRGGFRSGSLVLAVRCRLAIISMRICSHAPKQRLCSGSKRDAGPLWLTGTPAHALLPSRRQLLVVRHDFSVIWVRFGSARLRSDVPLLLQWPHWPTGGGPRDAFVYLETSETIFVRYFTGIMFKMQLKDTYYSLYCY